MIKTQVCENCECPVSERAITRVETVDGALFVCESCAEELEEKENENA